MKSSTMNTEIAVPMNMSTLVANMSLPSLESIFPVIAFVVPSDASDVPTPTQEEIVKR